MFNRFKTLSIAVLAVMLILAFAMVGMAQQAGPGSTVIYYPRSADPCENPSVAKSSVAINVSAATTTSLVSAVSGKSVYVCSMFGTTTATASTVTLNYGTTDATGACRTASADMTGAMTVAGNGNIQIAWGGTVVKATPGAAVCSTVGGGGVFKGVMTYVAQ